MSEQDHLFSDSGMLSSQNVYLRFISKGIKEQIKNRPVKTIPIGNSLVVQWLGFDMFTARARLRFNYVGTKIPQASRCSQKPLPKQKI